MKHEYSVDVLIVGGSLGAVAAAISCGRLGVRTLLVSPDNWLGGQATSQGVPPDEHPWIEYTGSTSTYREFRARIRSTYRALPRVDSRWTLEPRLNPGAGLVSPITHDPRVSVQVIEGLLLQYRMDGTLGILRGYEPVAAETEGDFVRTVDFGEFAVWAKQVVDATETGELLPLAGVEYVVGTEGLGEFDEPHGAEVADPMNQQAISWCAGLRWDEKCGRKAGVGEYEPIPKPAEYEYWKKQVAPFWPGPQLSFACIDPFSGAATEASLLGGGRPGTERVGGLWAYRRIHRPDLFTPSCNPAIDVTLVNWPQIDYWEAPVIDGPDVELQLRRAKGLTLSFIHWLQTEAPRDNGGIGYPEIRLYGSLFETTHGLARDVYIRESRRIRAQYTITENDIGVGARTALGDDRAADFPDSVGLASYRIDLHPSTGGDSYIDIESYPAQIPLASLIPERVNNLLAGCKNIGATHLASGMYRVHPAEWNIGEAAGALAAEAVRQKTVPRVISADPDRREAFQLLLHDRLGFELEWPPHIRTVSRWVPQLQWTIKEKRSGWHLA